MRLKIKDNNKLIDCFYSKSITELNKAIYQIDTDNKNINATLYIDEKKISCDELLGLKKLLLKSNIKLTHIYSSSRESVITAKSLQINSNLSNKYLDKSNPKIEDQSHNRLNTFWNGAFRRSNIFKRKSFHTGRCEPWSTNISPKKHLCMGEIMWRSFRWEKW